MGSTTSRPVIGRAGAGWFAPQGCFVSLNNEQIFSAWQERIAMAEAAVPVIGQLYRERGVVTLMYGRPLMHRTPTDIIDEHRYVASVEENDFNIEDTLPLLMAMGAAELAPVRIDLGKMGMLWRNAEKPDALSFLRDQLGDKVGQKPGLRSEPQDVVLYGFGRIGRLVARLLMERTGAGDGMRLRAIVTRAKKNNLAKRASLLSTDSVHGTFKGAIDIDEENQALIINGQVVKLIHANHPSEVDYEAHGIKNALICDNTGIWRDEEALGQHLQAKGAAKVLLTAPAQGEIKNLVCGVNDADMDPEDTILSAASCTTNAIAPVLKLINDEFGIENGHLETVHAYTNDQNLIDNFHKKERRGRAAALNMVITTTGAAKAVSKALPELKGKLTGSAIRVPTPNVSLAILSLNLQSEVTKDSLNDKLRWGAVHSDMHRQIEYTTSTEIVSSDVVGARHPAVVDSGATIADGKRCVLYVWYDNEFGYSVQVVRLLQRMAGIDYPFFPR